MKSQSTKPFPFQTIAEPRPFPNFVPSNVKYWDCDYQPGPPSARPQLGIGPDYPVSARYRLLQTADAAVHLETVSKDYRFFFFPQSRRRSPPCRFNRRKHPSGTPRTNEEAAD